MPPPRRGGELNTSLNKIIANAERRLQEVSTGREDEKRKFIVIYNDFILNSDYDNRDHFVYVLIKGFIHQRYGNVAIASVDSILSILGFTSNSRNKQGIKESIEKLVADNVIKIYSDIACKGEEREVKYSNTYFFKVIDAPYKEGYFTKVYYDDFFKFIKMDEKNKMKIFAVYHNIIYRMYDMDSSDKYTLPNLDDIEEETGINRKTVSKYIDILMDNELIYYSTMRKALDKTKHVYGRWEHRDIVRRFANEC
jgi:hypothetical protein